MASVEAAIRKSATALCMESPGESRPSSVLPDDKRARETHHWRGSDFESFRIHHLFLAMP